MPAMNPFTPAQLRPIAQTHGTPLWVYDAATIRERIASLKSFDVIRYAQKANSNLQVLRLMREQGVRVDAVSLGEIERAQAAGYDSADPQPPGEAPKAGAHAAGLVRTITSKPSIEEAAILRMIVLIRTVLSMSIQIEIEGTLPWRRALLTSGGQMLGEAVARDRAAQSAHNAARDAASPTTPQPNP